MENTRENTPNCSVCGDGECMGKASEIAYRSLMGEVMGRGLSGHLYVSSDNAYVTIKIITSKVKHGPVGTMIEDYVEPIQDIERFTLEKLTEQGCIGIVPTPSAKRLLDSLTRSGAKKTFEGVSEYTYISSDGVKDVSLSSAPGVYNLERN